MKQKIAPLLWPPGLLLAATLIMAGISGALSRGEQTKPVESAASSTAAAAGAPVNLETSAGPPAPSTPLEFLLGSKRRRGATNSQGATVSPGYDEPAALVPGAHTSQPATEATPVSSSDLLMDARARALSEGQGRPGAPVSPKGLLTSQTAVPIGASPQN